MLYEYSDLQMALISRGSSNIEAHFAVLQKREMVLRMSRVPEQGWFPSLTCMKSYHI